MVTTRFIAVRRKSPGQEIHPITEGEELTLDGGGRVGLTADGKLWVETNGLITVGLFNSVEEAAYALLGDIFGVEPTPEAIDAELRYQDERYLMGLLDAESHASLDDFPLPEFPLDDWNWDPYYDLDDGKPNDN